jgi:hypothetical protein
MMQFLFSRVSFLRNRGLARQRAEAQSAERREQWNQVLAEHQHGLKPVDAQKGMSTSSSGAGSGSSLTNG